MEDRLIAIFPNLSWESTGSHKGSEADQGVRMAKTDRQTILEMQHQKPIREIIEATLDKNRGRRHHLALTSLELDISTTTLYKWASELGIDLRMECWQQEETGEPTGAARE